MNSFITLTDHSTENLTAVLDRADVLHAAWHGGRMPASLAGKRGALWFFGNGFRNRMAFEMGAMSLGAEVSFVPGELGKHEPIEDIGQYLALWFDFLVVRAARHKDLVYLSQSSGIPLINARTDWNHPCEIMGDFQYIRRIRGSLDGLKVVFVGEFTNLCMSWFRAATRLPIEVVQIGPPKYLADTSFVDTMNREAWGRLSVSEALDPVLEGTDVLYTDCWPKSENTDEVRSVFLHYQIDTHHVDRINTDGFFLPCPPVTRGEEVTAEAMIHPLCKNHVAKEYLLHAQNAIMEYTMGLIQ